MKLVDNWRSVVRRSWSMRLGYLAGLCGIAAELLPFVSYLEGVVRPSTLTRVTLVLGALALVARLIPQQTVQPPPPADPDAWLQDEGETRPPGGLSA